jgi:hypothetical protein
LLCEIKRLLYYRPNCAFATGSLQINRMDVVNERVSRELPFLVIKQRVVVIYYRRFGTDKLFETSVRDHHYSLPNNSKEACSHLLRDGST